MGLVTHMTDYIATDYPSYGYVLILPKINDKWSDSLKSRFK
jgi:hypothetical protein